MALHRAPGSLGSSIQTEVMTPGGRTVQASAANAAEFGAGHGGAPVGSAPSLLSAEDQSKRSGRTASHTRSIGKLTTEDSQLVICAGPRGTARALL